MARYVYFSLCSYFIQLGPDPKKIVYDILHEYKIHNCEILFREDANVDDLIDVIEGNRKYVKCLYVRLLCLTSCKYDVPMLMLTLR